MRVRRTGFTSSWLGASASALLIVLLVLAYTPDSARTGAADLGPSAQWHQPMLASAARARPLSSGIAFAAGHKAARVQVVRKHRQIVRKLRNVALLTATVAENERREAAEQAEADARARAEEQAQQAEEQAQQASSVVPQPAPQTDFGDLSSVVQCIKDHESGNYAESSHIYAGSGAYQFIPGTWRHYSALAGYPGYAFAYQAPPAVQDAVLMYALTHGGAGNWSMRWGNDPCTAGLPGGG